MIKGIPAFFTAILFVIFVLTGCSGNPTVPGQNTVTPEVQVQQSAENHFLAGYYSLTVNTETGEIEVMPVRDVDLHLNITKIINATFGLGVALVPAETNLATGLIVFDMTITHPFPLNPEFSAFDMKGIMMTPGSLNAGGLVFADYDESRVLNADGYSRWWNPTEFTTPGIFGYTPGLISNGTPIQLNATVNPYKLFADVLPDDSGLSPVSAEPMDSPNGRAVFKAGESNTRRYRMQFEMNPSIQLTFGYAIDACWDIPSPNPPTDVPNDFPINANSNEAFRVAMAEVSNTLYYDDDAGSGGGSLVLNINVQDWQGIFNGNVHDQISAVTLMSPDLLATDVNTDFLSDSGTVAFYSADLTGLVEPTRAGISQIFCEVVSSDGTTYKQAVPPAPAEAVAAYQIFTVDIPIQNCESDANNDWLEAFPMNFGDTVNDMVCLPNDYRDFYYFEIPPGMELSTGQVTLNCDADQTKIGVYNQSQTLLSEASISGGIATIDLAALNLAPGTYYIRVYTSNTNEIGFYTLDLTGTLGSPPPLNITDVTPPGLYMYPRNVWLHDNFSYSFGVGYWVHDLSNPSSPQFVSGETLTTIYSDTVADFHYPYCYYLNYNPAAPPTEYDLGLIDFSNPSNPVLHDSLLPITREVTNICINSTHIYVCANTLVDTNILIYDYASDPLNPVLVGEYTLASIPRHLVLLDPEGPATQLVIATDSVVQVLGVEDPGAITDDGFIVMAPGWVVNDMVTADAYIYLAFYGPLGQLDILQQTGGGPIFKGAVNLPGDANYLEMEFPYVYISDYTSGISICDVTNPMAPAYLASFPTADFALRLAVENQTLCVIPNGGPIEIFDLTNPILIVSLGLIPAVVSPGQDVVFDGNYMYVGDGAPIFHIDVVDISDLSNAHIVASTPVTVGPWYIVKRGNLLITAYQHNLLLIDATDPLNLVPYGSYVLGSTIQALAIKDDYLYIAYNNGVNNIETWDVSDPTAPVVDPEIKTYAGSSMWDLVINGNLLYVPAGDGVRIYSVNNPGPPSFLSTYSTPEPSYNVVLQGQYMYLNMPSASILEVVDVSDPLSPTHVSTEFSAYAPISAMAIDSQYAFFSGGNSSISAIQIVPPDDPTDLGIVYDDNYPGMYLNIWNEHLIKNAGGFGLRIFDLY